MGLSAVKEYLPFVASKPPTFKQDGILGVDQLKSLSRAALTAVGAAWLTNVIFNTYVAYADPSDYVRSYSKWIPAVGFICFSRLHDVFTPKVGLYGQADWVSSAAMREFTNNPALLNKLIETAKKDPNILLKTNESGTTILKEFVSSAILRVPESQTQLVSTTPGVVYIPDFQPGTTSLRAETEMNVFHIIRTMTFLRELLLAAPWPKQELLECLDLIKNKNPNLLKQWTEVNQKIQSREDLSAGEKIQIENYFQVT